MGSFSTFGILKIYTCLNELMGGLTFNKLAGLGNNFDLRYFLQILQIQRKLSSS